MREIGWWLALGLANLAAILDCGHFVIGGGLIDRLGTRVARRRASTWSTSSRGTRASGDHRDAVDVRTALGRDGCGPRGLRAHVMKLGVLLPTFRNSADDALAFAERAVEAGHRRPLRLRPPLAHGFDRRDRPSRRFPCWRPSRDAHARHRRPTRRARRPRGTAHLVEQFLTLERVAPGAGDLRAGTGRQTLGGRERRLRRRRCAAPTSAARLMAETAREPCRTDMPVWFGAGNDETNRVARECRRDHQPLGRDARTKVRDDGDDGRGELGRTGVERTSPATLSAVRDAGATWAVFAPDVDVDALRQWRESTTSNVS